MNRLIITSTKAPAAIGPYSQAVLQGGVLFTAGQIPLDPETNDIVSQDFKVQARRVLENLKAVLEEAGFGFHHVVKTTVFLTSMNDFAALNEVYSEYLGEVKPARSTIAVAALPKNARVEIEAVAMKGA